MTALANLPHLKLVITLRTWPLLFKSGGSGTRNLLVALGYIGMDIASIGCIIITENEALWSNWSSPASEFCPVSD